MTSKERCLAVLHREKPDRVPYFPLTMFFAADRAGLNFREYATCPAALAEAQLLQYERYRVDAVTVCSDAFRISADLGAQMVFPENQTPFAARPLIGDPADLGRLKAPDPMRPGSRMRQRIESVEILARSVGKEALVCGWVEMPFAEVCDWFGVQELMFLMMDEPGLVHQALEMIVEMEIEFARCQLEAGADIIGCGDSAASLISAAHFREFALPYEQRVTEGIRAAGGLSKLHICGNTTHSLPLLARCGADMVNIDAQVDFDLAVRVFGDAGMSFKGNADPVRDLMNATPDQARAKGEELVRKARGLPFMLSAGCEIPAATKDETMMAFSLAAITSGGAS
jgi:MtaA/CmuA family methyltransferase